MNSAIISAQNRLTTNGVFLVLRAIGCSPIPFPSLQADTDAGLPPDKSVGYYIITGISVKPSSCKAFLNLALQKTAGHIRDRQRIIHPAQDRLSANFLFL